MMGSGIDAGPSRPTGSLPPTVPENMSNTNGTVNNDHAWKSTPEDQTKMSKLRDIVENSVSSTRKCVVDSILQQVNQLSQREMMLLYLKLPIGRSQDPDPLKQPLNPLGSRSEVQLTITWIKTHLQIDLDISLFKEDVYQEYLQYCENSEIKHLSKADFGKVMKQVFPSVRARRLGQRGDSKYTYSGLTKRSSVAEPLLPDLSQSSSDPSEDLALEGAAGCVILEWAEKKGTAKCGSIKELAFQLISTNSVDTRSVAACALLSDQTPDSSMGKHQLHKKLQEKEQLREQKRKQEACTELTRCSSDRLKDRRKRVALKNTINQTTMCTPILPNKNTLPKQPGVMEVTHNGNCNKNGQLTLAPIKQENESPSVQLSKEIRSQDKTVDVELDERLTTPLSAKSTTFDYTSSSRNVFLDGVTRSEIKNKFEGTPDFNNSNMLNTTNAVNNSVATVFGSNRNKVNGKASVFWNHNYPHIEDLQHGNDMNTFEQSQPMGSKVTNSDEFRSPLATSRDFEILELKKFLTEKNVVPSSSVVHANPLTINEEVMDFANGNQIGELRRRVSFQSPNNPNFGQPPTDSHVVHQPVDNSKCFNFQTLSNQVACEVPCQMISHSSSTNASPFGSPTDTPMYRSRNNSGQTSSTYVTPRSTPFTPDMVAASENGTPFMSPAQTPQRSRHTSSQNIRAVYPFAGKTRHSSGTPFYRHAPYHEDFSGRRKFRSRNSSGNMPQSAPLSPLVHDNQMMNQMQEGSFVQLHHTTDPNHVGNQKRPSLPVMSVYDNRRRHASAGPTIAFQTQTLPPNYFNMQSNPDALSLEVTTTLGNQCGQTTNRPNSVPLPQMMVGPGNEVNMVAKSYPSTPIVNQQFDFGQDCMSQPSYTATPVPSDYNDFHACNNLDLNPLIEDPLNDPNATSLNHIDPSLPHNLTGNIIHQLPPTTNFQDSYAVVNNNNNNAFSQEDESSHFMQNVTGPTFSNSMAAEVARSDQPTQPMGLSSQLTLNALNATQNSDLSFDPATSQLEDDFPQTLSSLDDNDDFHLVLGVSRD